MSNQELSGTYKKTPENGENSSARMVKLEENDKNVSNNAVSPSPTNSKDEKDKKEKEEIKMVGVFELFRFANGLDWVLMFFGTIAALVHGASLPLMILVFGDMIDAFVVDGATFQQALIACNNMTNISLTAEAVRQNPDLFTPCCAALNMTCPGADDILEKMTGFAIYYVAIGCGVWLAGYMEFGFWSLASERQARRIRLAFFRSVLKQEIGWFDTHESGELNTRMSDDIKKIQAGMGDKTGIFFQWMSGCIAGVILGFVKGWLLTLVILAISPLLIISGGLMTHLTSNMTTKELQAYAKAGAVAEEVLGAIRTVVAFGGQHKESSRYNSNLHEAKSFGIKKSLTNGLGMGFIWFVIFGAYGLGFGYGAHLIRTEPETYSVGVMFMVFFAILIAAFSLGNAAPSLATLGTARGAAHTVYAIIDQQPSIDSSSTEGKTPDKVTGRIQFENVHFTYPSRKEVKVLNGLNITAEPGQTVALVGSSGCGKSTTVQLLQRFYDPEDGKVTIDGVDIRELNVKWLRTHIGIVSQEPVLFATTIKENIAYGRDGVTQEEIEQACKEANAYDFIMTLPKKFDTLVGERGAQLSGGQKQRIAIARALVRQPKILLLDEATSALDTESEGIVQAALDKVRLGRTTLVIAHRLSTIKTADIIVGFQDGVAMEMGTHDELMAKDGVYYKLVTSQSQKREKVDEELEEEEESDEELDEKQAFNRTGSRHSGRKVERMTSVVSVRSDDKEHAKEEEEKLPDPPVKRIMRLNAPEWFYIVVGCFSSLINGAVQPAFAIIFAEFIGVFIEYRNDDPRQADTTLLYSLLLLGMGAVAGIAMVLQAFFFGISGENLTMRLRQMAFKAMLRQEIGWFDNHKNSTGALTTRLATETSAVQAATGARLGAIMQAIANMGTAMVLAFIFSWELTLLIVAFLPVIAVGGAMEMKIQHGAQDRDKNALEEAGKTAVEAIENMRTVASLSREQTFHELYNEKITEPYKTATKQTHLTAFVWGFSQGVIFFCYAAAFKFGAFLIKEGRRDFEDIMKVFSCVVFGAMALGQASAFAGDYTAAKLGASHLFALFDRTPDIDSESEEGQKLSGIQGAVDFHDVEFCYPTRPNHKVLRGLKLSVQPGQTVALVGSSGCGKSTTVQLLERFYDPALGQVRVDNTNLADFNVQWIRNQVGIVSQEPILFDCSIAENIAYGDNTREVAMDEIIAAARGANIHSFIESLPLGYDTNVGDKGTQLSGGQKQRVAIARALVRNPKILLLDEATSALDTESEKIVQEALDRAQEGRTSIVIAHRLSTVKNADQIAVISHGKVRELGTHSELLSQKGLYYKLNVAQLHVHD